MLYTEVKIVVLFIKSQKVNLKACQLHVPVLGLWEDGDRYANNIIQVSFKH